MKVAVVYVYPLVNVAKYRPLAKRFADTWKQFPPGNEPHELHVILNGSSFAPDDAKPLMGLKHQKHYRDNFAWDIGSYLYAARKIKCDLMVCLGAPVHFYRAGWLDRMVSTWLDQGPGIGGCWGFKYPDIHIRTTAFWTPPQFLLTYPHEVTSVKTSRYGFEHGSKSFTRHCKQLGFSPYVATWKGVCYEEYWPECEQHIGNCLCLDQHTYQ